MNGAGARARRAFTVLEVLIVLALILALGALVFPPLARWVEEYRFAETIRQFEGTMDACGVRAQRAGRALVVTARVEDGAIRVRSRELAVRPEGEDKPREAPAPPPVRFTFPRSFRVDTGAGGVGEPRAAEAAGSSSPETEIAVLLPDGTAAAGPGWRISDGHGRAAEIAVERWGGRVRLNRVARPVGAREEVMP